MSFPIDVNIPAATNDPADDQPRMMSNFANISGYLTVDHVAPGKINNGIHKQVHFTNQTAPGQIGLGGVQYANLDANNHSWPFWQNDLGSFQMFGNDSIMADGYVTLPSGLIFQWGIVNGPLASSGPVSFNINFPTACFNVSCTLIAKVGGTNQPHTISPIDGTVTASGFTYNYEGSTSYSGFYWTAIGN